MDDVDNNNYVIHREDYSVSIVYLCVSGVFMGGGERGGGCNNCRYYVLQVRMIEHVARSFSYTTLASCTPAAPPLLKNWHPSESQEYSSYS